MKRLVALIGLLLASAAQAQTPDSRPGCTYNLVAPTLTTAQQVALQCDANGQLKIAGSINATSAATATAAAPTYIEGTSNPLSQDLSGNLRVTGTFSLGANQSVNLTQVGGAAVALGQTTMSASLPVAIASNQSAVPASQSGTWNIGTVTTLTGIINALPAGTNLLGKVEIDQTTPGTTNGISQNASQSVSGTLQSAAVANGNGTPLSVLGQAAAVLTVNCAACSGGTQINFEATEDGSNWRPITAVTSDGLNYVTVVQTTGISAYEISVAGYQSLRARISAYSAGTVTITGHAVPLTHSSSAVDIGNVLNTVDTNLKQINGQTTLAGNGVTGTGSQRVTIASDNTAFSVNAIQSGTWTVQPGNTANTTPWLVTGSGTAGSAAAGVLSIQGIASMTPVQVSQATAANLNATVVGTGTFAVQATLSAETTKVIGTVRNLGNAGAAFDAATGAAVPANGLFVGLSDGTNLRGWLNAANALNSTGAGIGTAQVVGQFDDVAPTAITENQFGNLRMSANRNAYTTIRDAAGNERGVNVNASNQLSVSVDAVSATNISTNIAQMNGVTVTMGNGASGTGVQRVTIANDSTGIIALTTGSAQIGHLEANQSVNVAQINGVTPLMGAGNTGTGSPRVTIASDQATIPVSTTAVTSGGTTLYTLTLAASTNATNVKASAGQVYSISGFNMSSATPVWISLYNNSGTPTCGTSIIQQFMIPGNTTGAGFVYDFATPKAFSSGIAFCATTGIAGTGNPAATTYVLNIDYK